MWPTLEPMQQQSLSLSDIANRLNKIGITTVTGKQFQPQTIKNIIQRNSKS
jgi:hypothetical protein